MLTRSLSLLALPVFLALAVPALGCGGGVAQAQVSSGEPASRAPVAPNAHGPVKLVAEALGDVPLTATQRSHIEQLAASADERHAEARTARRDLEVTLAAQVQAGHIDRAALSPKIDAVVAALQKAQPADRASFEQLHAILSADQRVAFVDSLEAHIGEHRGAWRERRPMKQWADALKLSDDQKKQIHAALKEHFEGAKGREGGHGGDGAGHHWGEAHERGAKVFTAFKQDRFVIDEVAPAKDVGKQVAHMTGRVLGLAEAVLPVLTPDQRALAAQKIRDGAGLPGMGGAGGGGL